MMFAILQGCMFALSTGMTVTNPDSSFFIGCFFTHNGNALMPVINPNKSNARNVIAKQMLMSVSSTHDYLGL